VFLLYLAIVINLYESYQGFYSRLTNSGLCV